MKITTEKAGKRYFVCEECGFAYAEKALAQKCEEYCKKHQSCSLEITKKAVKYNEGTK